MEQIRYGMLSREEFLDRFQKLLSSGTSEGYSLLYCNVCNFRYYNIQFGREAGDEVLKFLASEILSAAAGDLNGYYGSDHFVTVTNRQNLEDLVKAVRKEFNQKYSMSTMMLKIGILKLNGRKDASNCCELAKLACDSIRDSQDFYRFYDQSLGKESEHVAYILQNVRKALNEGWIHVYYQPVVRTINGKLCGLEALVRWIDPVRGFLSPAEFIPVLEENQQITQLDLYVLNEVCRTIHESLEQGECTVPVSINLSRLDFTECDIFQEVEDCVRKYQIARDFLNLEVTESTVMRDPDLLKKEIHRFREAGYEIWMDDFGSGYSSLNVLENFEFDEIKLDMLFLRTFDEKSRRIVRSIISMAKEMQLQTLAEGVETKEQYEFLKNIGCEKVQGYYFSKPVPPEKIREMYHCRKGEIERRSFRKYYASAGTVNFFTDQAMGIIDFDGEKFHLLYGNQHYLEVWKKVGFDTQSIESGVFNTSDFYFAEEARMAMTKLTPGAEAVPLQFNVLGSIVNLRARILAREQDHCLLCLEGLSLHQRDVPGRGDNDFLFHMLFSLFNEVFLIHLYTGRFEVIKAGINQASISEEWEKQSWALDPRKAAKLYIQKEDQEDYIHFMDPERLRERMEKGDLSPSAKVFRCLAANGSYELRMHTIQLIPGTDLALYSSENIPAAAEKNRTDIDLSSTEGMEHYVAETLLHSRVLNVFWKDTDRKFLGANTKFLETYGIRDRAELIGKTDEDMHWNLNDASFREDEIRILRDGIPVRNHVGKCIIQGKAHSILVSKEPVYENGKIIGLAGVFMSMDDLAAVLSGEDLNDADHSFSSLMSSAGIYHLAEMYQEGWEFRKEKFAAILLNSHTFQRASQTYGYEMALKMVSDFESKLRELCASQAAAGRIYAGEFLILIHYEQKEDAEAFRDQLEQMCRSVTSLAGYPETIDPEIRISYSEDPDSMNEIMRNFTRKA